MFHDGRPLHLGHLLYDIKVIFKPEGPWKVFYAQIAGVQ